MSFRLSINQLNKHINASFHDFCFKVGHLKIRQTCFHAIGDKYGKKMQSLQRNNFSLSNYTIVVY